MVYGGIFLLLQQRSKHPREMVQMPKASISRILYCTHSTRILHAGWRGVHVRRTLEAQRGAAHLPAVRRARNVQHGGTHI